jgi:hypothetical protein
VYNHYYAHIVDCKLCVYHLIYNIKHIISGVNPSNKIIPEKLEVVQLVANTPTPPTTVHFRGHKIPLLDDIQSKLNPFPATTFLTLLSRPSACSDRAVNQGISKPSSGTPSPFRLVYLFVYLRCIVYRMCA